MNMDLRKALERLAEYRPDDRFRSSVTSDDSVPTWNSDLLPPHFFYPRHLDSRLLLKDVVVVPSLSQDIASVFWSALPNIGEHNPDLPPLDEIVDVDPRFRAADAESVRQRYIRLASSIGCKLSSNFVFHLKTPSWRSVVGWNKEKPICSIASEALQENWSPKIELGKLGDLVDEETGDMAKFFGSGEIPALEKIESRFQRIACLQFFAEAAEVIITFEEMDKLSNRPFLWTGCRNSTEPGKSTSISPLSPIFDVPHVKGVPQVLLPSKYPPVPLNTIRRSTRLRDGGALPRSARSHPQTELTAQPQRLLLGPAQAPSLPGTIRTADASSILQYAWYRAVQEDATILILHAGRFERIGIRHRDTRTLYLSEMIDTYNTQYGALLIGLYICILKDLLFRIPLYIKAEERTRTKRETRNKINHPGATIEKAPNSDLKEVLVEASSCDLALLRFNHGVLRSPNPSALLRVGGNASARKRAFEVHQYMTLTVSSYIASGATADVHNATLDLLTKASKRLECAVIVKLAILPEQRKRLRHEFALYQHLSSSGATSIPRVIGLFQDTESRALALIMENVGVCVLDHRAEPPGSQYTFTANEKERFLAALNEIHQAGVRHRDIRPENMLLDRDGRAYFIDFDKASIGASEASRAKELDHLHRLMNGQYVPPGEEDSLTDRDFDYQSDFGPSSV